MPINIFSTIDHPLAPSITEAHGIGFRRRRRRSAEPKCSRPRR
jgi:hypothetical protein